MDSRYLVYLDSIYDGIYPGHLWGLWLVFSIVSGMHFLGNPAPLAAKLTYLLDATSVGWQLVGCFLTAVLYWLAIIFALRYTLKLLLMYKGWMYEERGNGSTISLSTKLWFMCVKILSTWKAPKLYSFQGLLPRLPLPRLHETTARYLRSVRPFLDDGNYDRVQQLVVDFQSGIGRKLQLYLWLKSWWSSNYVSDWWEEYVYLRGRSPLMIKSNFYAIDSIFVRHTTKQAARAAGTINSFLAGRRLIDTQELKPLMIQGVVPLCSGQYERAFNTARVPGLEVDTIQHFRESDHIVVYHKGRYFKVVIHKGRILKPCEIQIQIQQILDDHSEPLPGEEKLAALTAGERTHWARTRQTFFGAGINKFSLDIIESAAFFVVLDDFPYEYDAEDPSKLDTFGKMLMHGRGCDRWFDKSFNLCIGNNGRIGFNAEHTWADAAVIAHIWEYVAVDESNRRYDDNGDTIGEPELTPPTPVRLNWAINHECEEAIEKSLEVANDLIENYDLRIYIHDNYGKSFIKQCRLSPDGYLQMALQLAYFRDAGQLPLTYEATITRLYKKGRTETVRSCSVESSAWVKAMDDPERTTEERRQLLKQACERHQMAFKDAMCGKGIDRHLFSLYMVSKYLKVESPFLQEVFSESWKLSTSQTPQGQTGDLYLKRPEALSIGGGFGPAADDGYGIAYFIYGENRFFFHISNNRSSDKTDCRRFARALEKALSDMKNLFGGDHRSQNGTSKS